MIDDDDDGVPMILMVIRIRYIYVHGVPDQL